MQYIPPSESPYFSEDTFSTLETEISHFQAQGNVLICGDTNARTGTLEELIDPQGDKYITNGNMSHAFTLPHRNNSDQVINRSGRDLVQLCQSLSLYFVNGRVRGDSLGRPTYSSPLGHSTVDYMITDLDPSSLSSFTVKPLTPLSDHSQITLFIKRSDIKMTNTQPNKLYNIRNSYRWDQNSTEQYQKAIDTPKIQTLLDNFLDCKYSHSKESLNLAVNNINNIFRQTAKEAQLKLNKNKPKTVTDKKWFDTDCKMIRNNIRTLSNQKHRDPQNADLRFRYYETLKLYKRTLRLKKQQYNKQQLTIIEEAINTNNFWQHWKRLNKPQYQELAIQNSDIWTTHFKTLYHTVQINANTEQSKIQEKLTKLELAIKNNQNPLDSSITEQELSKKLQALKCKKACGPDGILNEMLINMNKKFQLAILKLFNLVLSVGYFPDIWNLGLITPIYKNGDKFDPNNYRGICVNSNLGKVFSSIMNARLLNFLTTHSVLSKSQIGFIPKQRTTDHIYTLHTLIDKYINQNKTKLYACFIDFQKAFDNIWHIGLFYKIITSGVGGKTYDIIKSMYSGNMCSIKIGNKRTELFTQGRGVRQGCNLSPALFNIYINELANILETSSVPGVSLHNQEVKCLLFADDLVLLSPTAQGLQQSLDLLEHYCQTWALTINPKKTKTMIFQKRSKSQDVLPKFSIGRHKVEYCTHYTYLGIKISSTGHFNEAVHELREKARRAFYAIKKNIQTEIPIQIWLKLIECVIEPIALYGSEVWGPLTKQDFPQWDKHPIETLHAELCKTILHVQRKTTNNACRAELGKYPLIIKIQKRAINFWTHLKLSDPLSYHYQAMQYQEVTNRNPLTQLILRLKSQTCPTNTAQEQNTSPIRPNQITKQLKENYISYWQTQTKAQSKMQCYLALNRQYTIADYLSMVTDQQLKRTLTKYRLSEHSLAIEKGRHRKTWLPAEQRLCSHCTLNEPETELHFLTKCEKYKHIRETHFQKFESITTGFITLTDEDKLPILLGEDPKRSNLAAVYVTACHRMRDSE